MDNEEIAGRSAEPIPEMRPVFQAGWIFRDGDALAVERRGNRAGRTEPGRVE